jgi:AcrR family transcriptional regulator
MRKLDQVVEKSVIDEAPLAERLLDAAEAEIVEKGTTEISLRSIARRAGVSHQAPGYVFADRTGLLTALAVRGYRLLDAAIAQARDRQGVEVSGRETVVEMGVAYVRTAAERPALFWLLSRPDLGTSSKELAQARGKAVATLLEAVHGAMADGWHRDGSPDDLASLCWATVHGLAALHGYALSELTAASLEATARKVLRALLVD